MRGDTTGDFGFAQPGFTKTCTPRRQGARHVPQACCGSQPLARCHPAIDFNLWISTHGENIVGDASLTIPINGSRSHPRPTNGICVAITVSVGTFTSRGRLAM